jgi:hypothetical protein
MFIYLFVISIIGIVVAITVERKRTQKTLLQILKSSCSIDSVQFEKHVSAAQIKTNTFKKYVHSISRISSKKAFEYNNLALKKIKYFIRKKLHPDTKKEMPSEFISKINSK